MFFLVVRITNLGSPVLSCAREKHWESEETWFLGSPSLPSYVTLGNQLILVGSIYSAVMNNGVN